jgi:hypothetical protein
MMWATMRAASNKDFKARPEDFLLRPPEQNEIEIEIEVDPVAFLSAVFMSSPPPRPEADDQREVE